MPFKSLQVHYSTLLWQSPTLPFLLLSTITSKKGQSS